MDLSSKSSGCDCIHFTVSQTPAPSPDWMIDIPPRVIRAAELTRNARQWQPETCHRGAVTRVIAGADRPLPAAHIRAGAMPRRCRWMMALIGVSECRPRPRQRPPATTRDRGQSRRSRAVRRSRPTRRRGWFLAEKSDAEGDEAGDQEHATGVGQVDEGIRRCRLGVGHGQEERHG